MIVLTKISLKNFKSYKNKITFNLLATPYKILEDKNVYHGNDHRILKGLLFVGANASGKTNIILALKILLDLLFMEQDVNLSVYKSLLTDEDEIELEYEFLISDYIINYKIIYDTRLKSYSESVELGNKEVLSRKGTQGHSMLSKSKDIMEIDQNLLFLRYLYFNTKFSDNPVLKEWMNYLENSVYLNAYTKKISSKMSGSLLIHDYLEKYGEEDINYFFERYSFDQKINYVNEVNGNFYSIKMNEKNKNIFFNREGLNNPIPIQYESLGNQNLINMLPSFFYVVRNGGMLIIDEFSSGLHNKLEELLIDFFFKYSNNSQIFFVSHSTNLLTHQLIRPDQVYSVDFNGREGSTARPFSEEKPREGQNIEKMYLSGVFDGLPTYDNSSK